MDIFSAGPIRFCRTSALSFKETNTSVIWESEVKLRQPTWMKAICTPCCPWSSQGKKKGWRLNPRSCSKWYLKPMELLHTYAKEAKTRILHQFWDGSEKVEHSTHAMLVWTSKRREEFSTFLFKKLRAFIDQNERRNDASQVSNSEHSHTSTWLPSPPLKIDLTP